ncbi:hypothetical protein GC163_17085 [bacterium]|nr:hypothetical protein [bacterium]
MMLANRHGMASRLGVIVALAGMMLAGLLVWLTRSPNYSHAISAADQAWQRQDFDRTRQWAQTALSLQPDSQPAHLLAGLACDRLGLYPQALEHLDHIDDTASQAALARQTCGDLCLRQLHRPTLALEHYQRLLQLQPQNVHAEQQLAYLLGLSGRWREAEQHRLHLIQLQESEPVLLYLLCSRDSLLENVEDLITLQQAAPDDTLLAPGLARKAREDGDIAAAEQRLRKALDDRPNDTSTQVDLGQLLVKDPRKLAHWYRALPKSVQASAGVWSLLGIWAADQSQTEVAARCFWDELRLDPNDARANYQLGRLLVALHRDDDAAVFLERAEQLEQYYQFVTQAWTGNDPSVLQATATTARNLGLTWEAYGWAYLTARHFPQTAWAPQMLKVLQREVEDLPLVRTIQAKNPAYQLDLSAYPLPNMPDDSSIESPPADSFLPANRDAIISFTDLAAQSGFEFPYYNGAPRDQQTRRMYEFNGGGVGVLDYDNDGRPDLFMTQGATWPPKSGSQAHTDRLFRNGIGDHFLDVTDAAHVRDGQFSAGVSIGDLDNDGFPDVYVANVGRNRLLMNNGDGTFRDVTEATKTAGDDWSTSCAIADLNGDSLPDLYVVNYLKGEDLFERLCRDEDNHVRSCSPREFAGAQDRLYMNSGDGTFFDITATSGIQVEDGKGLGIAVADFTGSGHLDIFIANDAVPNFYFANTGHASSTDVLFTEEALVRGVAFNEAGRAEACMGIAVGDADGDARLDLFVTNFYNESNTFYRQLDGGEFLDATRQAQLDTPSLKMLGFGTQFLDADRDGDLDLFVANGHIDDLTDTGIPLAMRPQFFGNDGQGCFVELASESVGSYFDREQLGRGAAIVDWNCDGLEDLVVSHLDTPAALLTNRSPEPGHAIRLNLKGTQSSRDAIGTTVTVETAGKTIMRQLSAGDGFQASNQRRLVIGLGSADTIDRLHVRWPSGNVSTLTAVPINTEVLLIEARDTVVMLPKLR